jgi:beta-1,4-N-acetylglucosaminyltransferase
LSIQRQRLVWATSPIVPGHGTAFFAKNDASVLVVLGSGGHTKEMLLMMEAGFGRFSAMRRHYIVSSGDTQSIYAAKSFEDGMAATHGDAGRYDVHIVQRARRVHQSLLTTPFSAARSFCQILPLLSKHRPDVILTNGPATGYFVGVAAYLIKLLYAAPTASLHVIYIESWARVNTLSLTGKLFHHTRLADTFLVQHDAIAQRYGIENAGWLVGAPE